MTPLWIKLLLLPSITVAFVPQRKLIRRQRGQFTHLYDITGDNDEKNNENNRDESSRIDDDVEDARKQLESMLSGCKDGVDNNSSDTNELSAPKSSILFSKILSDFYDGVDFSLSSFPPPTPLSSIGRERRLTEIKLLECLVDGDEAVPELWDFWYSERGSNTKYRLEKIGGLFSDAERWKECEKDLVEIIDEHGIYFVEPVNLLATLSFLQGKLKLSYKLCEIILALKPYHIGALSGIVEVALGLDDMVAAREWALKRLPSAPPDPNLDKDTSFDQTEVENPRRVQWVEKAVSTAKELLDQAERTKEDFFGNPETYYNDAADIDVQSGDAKSLNDFDDEIDESAWQ